MAYNNGFPMNYPQYYPQFQQNQIPIQQQSPAPANAQQSNPMIWVQGETGAKSYLLTPNTTLPLWDSERQTIYLKSTDASGMPSMKVLDYTIREQAQPQAQSVSVMEQPKMDFVTHDELKDFEKEISHKIEEIKENIGA